MSNLDQRILSLRDALTNATLDRRTLIKRGALLGVSLPVIGGLIAACDDDEDDDDGEDVGATEPDDDDDDEVEVEVEDTDDTDDEEDPDDVDDDTEEDDDADAEEGDGRYGGVLYDAIVGEMPSHDLHTSTASIVSYVMHHMYETLFTYDGDMEVQPELADTFEVSDDGLTVTLSIREGVHFHNGEPLTAEDVIASIDRWGELSARAGVIPDVATITAVDDLTTEWELTDPIGPLQHMLARQNHGCVIIPAETAEAVGTSPIQDTDYYIGTGPYQFEEYLADRHFKVVRYDDYTSHSGEPSGYYGMKYQYLDEIYFIPVPDETARVSGLQAGDYHYVAAVGPDWFETLDADPDINVETLPPQGWPVFVLNMREGLMTNHTLRRAIQATLCSEEMLTAAYGDWWELDPAVVVGADAWYTTAGEEYYNQCDPELGWELAQEAGYDGEPIRWIVTQEYQDHFDYTSVAVQQLTDAGFNIDLQIYDWATLTTHRNTPGDYEIATTSHTFRPEPLALTMVPGTEHDGWWDTPEKNELVIQLQRESEHEVRFEIWEQIQQLFYEQVPRIKVGNRLEIHAMSAKVQNWNPTVHLQVMHANHWLED